MSNKAKLFVVIFMPFLWLFPFQSGAGEESVFSDPKKTISMDFQDAGLKDILKVFSIQSGLNFIASEAVQERKITLYLDKVSIKEAMDKIFMANNLYYELDKDSNILIAKDRGKPQLDLITRVFYLKYATVSSSSLKEEMSSQIIPTATTSSVSITGATATTGTTTGTAGKWGVEKDAGITKAIKQVLSSYGSVIEDYRTNSLVVTDMPTRMPIIAQTIASLDVPIPQVMLEVEMLDVSKNVVDKLGFDFSANPITLILPGGFLRRGTEYFIGTMARRKNEITSSGAAGSVVLGSTFGQALDFLRTQTDTKYLARPRLLTLNNETAEIKIITKESIGITTITEATTGTTNATPERFETGVLLRVTPQVNTETGEVTMFIYPQVSEATGGATLTSGGESFIFRDPEIRSTKSVVKVKDGQTVILGGLIRNEFIRVTKKIPLLGDIPLIGALFRHQGGDNDKNKERELLVFITPRIIKDTTADFASAKKVFLPEREQTAVSTYGRRFSITSSLDNFEKTTRKSLRDDF